MMRCPITLETAAEQNFHVDREQALSEHALHKFLVQQLMTRSHFLVISDRDNIFHRIHFFLAFEATAGSDIRKQNPKGNYRFFDNEKHNVPQDVFLIHGVCIVSGFLRDADCGIEICFQCETLPLGLSSRHYELVRGFLYKDRIQGECKANSVDVDGKVLCRGRLLPDGD